MEPINDFLSGYSGATRLGYRSSIFQFLDYKFGFTRKAKDSTPEERVLYEKMAAKSGNSAYVYLPAKWAGKKVKIIALEPVED